MKKQWFFAPVLIATALILLASCSGETAPTQAQPTTARRTSHPMPAPVPTPSLPMTPQPEATSTVEPPTPTEWGMATPGPEPTERPKDAPLTKDDYFIIDKNWVNEIGDWGNDFFIDELEGYRYGVIDMYGNIIVPFTAFHIDKIVLSPVKNEPNKEKLLFFARDYLKVGGKIVRDSGYLYLPNGKKASSNLYNWVQTYQDNRIAAERTNSGLCGVMDANMNPIIHFRYLDMVVFDNWIAATKKKPDGSYWIDFFDKNCKAIGSLKVGDDDIEYLDQNLLMAKGENDKWGFIDQDLTWCAQPKWDSHAVEESWDEYFGPGYVMKLRNTKYNVNKFGKEFIPKGLAPEECYLASPTSVYDGHFVYIFDKTNEDGQIINSVMFDDAGRIMYQSNGGEYHGYLSLLDNGLIVDGSLLYDINKEKVNYQSVQAGLVLSVQNGIILDNGCMYDLSGKRLFSNLNNIIEWDQENDFIICSSYNELTSINTTTVYTVSGSKLPLPKNAEIHCLSSDRFLVQFTDGLNGVCNSEGKWIIKPSRYYLDEGWDEVGSYFTSVLIDEHGEGASYSRLFGVCSFSSGIIYNPIFTYLSPLNDHYFEVYYQGIHGVIDDKGNWIWYTDIVNSYTD